MKELAGWQAR
ncbi:hypothetical protein LINPERPRIM_LOCUS14441 [Linum perenne]